MLRTSSAAAPALLALAAILAAPGAAAQTYHGTGTVRAALPRLHRMVVDAGEIPGYMAAMEMSFPVSPPALLEGLRAGDRIEFTIDKATATIIAVKVIGPR